MKSAILDLLRENFEITGDNAVMVLDTYCQTLERHVRELGAAINDEDVLKIRAVTHSLIGCSSIVGAISILMRAGEINQAAHRRDLSAARRSYALLCEEVRNLD